MDINPMIDSLGVGTGTVAISKPPVSLDLSLAWWRGWDLSGRKRASINAEAEEILRREDQSKLAKKELMEEVKKWKKLSPEDKKEGALGLIVRFQSEFDLLTTRAKSVEKYFLGLVKELEEAPDPSSALGAAVDSLRQMSRLREENARLASEIVEARAKGTGAAEDLTAELEASRREVALLEVELGKLSNQDITIRQLEARIAQIDNGIEGAVAERVAVRESEMRKVVEAELEKVRETETTAEGRVKSILAQLAEISAERDTAQAALFTSRARADEELSQRSSEVDALAGEVERLRTALVSANSSSEDLRKKLAAAVAASMGEEGSSAMASSATSSDPYASLRASLAAHKSRADAAEEEANRLSNSLYALQEESKRWKEVLESARGVQESLMADATKRCEAKETECAQLRLELSHAPSAGEVAGLKTQLRLLQALHFNAGSGDSLGGGTPPPSLDGGSQLLPTTEDVTTVMLRRVRQLEAELVKSEQGRGEANGFLHEARLELEKLREELSDSKTLCAQLEDSLAGGYGAGGSADGVLVGDEKLRDALGVVGGEDSAAAQLTSLLPELTSSAGLAGRKTSSSSSELEASAGLALALRGQRDRFRTRILELEAAVHARSAELTETSSRCKKLTEDNVALFEKIRFLQFMASGGAGTPSADAMERGGGGELRARGVASAASASHAAAAAAATEDEVDSVYGKLYAEKLDPFAEYKAGEKARQYAALRRTDRIVFTGSSLLLSSRYSRKALFFYSIILHLLFVYMLWHWIHSDCSKHGDHFAAVPVQHALRGPPGGALQ